MHLKLSNNKKVQGKGVLYSLRFIIQVRILVEIRGERKAGHFGEYRELKIP
jgi:hypothetical protein